MKILFVKLTKYRGLYWKKEGVILIDSRLKGEEWLEVLIHEALHAADWSKSEKKVTKTAKKMARMLYKTLKQRLGV